MDNYAFSSSFGFGHINRLGAQDEPSNNIIYPHGKLMFIEPGYACRYAEFPGNYADVSIFSHVVRPDEVFVVVSECSYYTEVGTLSAIYNGFFVSLKTSNNGPLPRRDMFEKVYVRESFNPLLEEYSHDIPTYAMTYDRLISIECVWKRMNLCDAIFDTEFPYLI